ncbi:toxic anion resistance protein [Slackia heliotrinireducens]|uniref:Uncharacterized protein involved in tellurite resistance n=1 Tax=Slackia heliotrinireducens (strain ATCC 29202 / DSM 20476 / NCTC 11029 / RHS 1) TaxID=471855 RepID=C7N787_SLAHD|nr:toxic anion resistance protein [Slackia heliotrinireducens]ACV22772.1 uncharacterized protein involved in tellurite resistance [Slackia heliotrinireducens DSM 20476]VEH01448.1 TelA-like protein SA1238 [Slackia heliotrinireducens]
MANEFDFNQDGSIPTPKLEFGTPVPAAPAAPEVTPTTIMPAPPEGSALTAEERAQVTEFVKQIDLEDSSAVLSYGVGAQHKVADFSERALENVRTKDLGEMGQQLSTLVVQLGKMGPDEEEQGGFLGLFKKGRDKTAALKANYSTVEANVREISNQLEAHQRELLKDIGVLDRMYELNAAYFKELSMYVLAGKEKIAQVRAYDIPAAIAKADESGKPEDAQAARDLAVKCDRFEKRVYDLELTREIALQTAPQIRMVQASDALMAEKIQSTVVNTIPLWKNQMVIALGVEHANQAAAATHQVTEMTNELLRRNADALKTATVAAARESERGIVDIETLRHTNEQLIATLDEVMQIQREGSEKRAAAEAELAQIEGQLHQKLIEAAK